ncbi:MAG TPA: type I DNA topoisomerase [Candidatus Saccharimonadales bacterium]|nr:type I DNA topoisomerase [Candidatus Saccharimonadales bacterium]
MAKNLVIVESPAKARTLAQFLGSDYKVESTFGHIRDLPKKELGVDIKKNFEPTYEISPDKQKVVAGLKKAAKGHTVWLASDEDREGEAIAWHVCYILGLDPKKTNRIVFHEITKPAITEAVAHPRTIDVKLFHAQQARRVLDRLVGYELSPVLWKKVRAGLSAGRVQSVAVRLIVEREREITDHKPESTFKVTAIFDAKGEELAAELEQKISDINGAKKFLEFAKDANFSVASVEQKPGTRSPAAPFTTSTLQQEAARRLGYSVRQTMSLAQRLYENGHISYMRTDSTNLSPLAIDAAKAYITKNFGDKYSQSRQYKTKDKSAQEAHEAIRPSNITKTKAGADAQQQKIYDLIWRRAVASQMAPAQIDKTEVKIAISGHDEQFIANGEVLRFDGFYKVYGGGKEDQILPVLKKADKLKLQSLLAAETFSRPPARYSEATLVRKLEELGIGRPSTYAPTIGTIQDRGYIEKKDLEGEHRTSRELSLEHGKITERAVEQTVGADRSKLVPTQLADIVTDFLTKYFASILDYDFTARAEEELDDIADGKTQWQDALARFYEHFHPLIEKSKDVSRSETLQVRELGKDPKSGEPVLVRYGRYGPVLQIGKTPDKKDKDAPKPRFAPLPADTTLEDVNLEQALPMFNLPREVGQTVEGQTITADIGRFGPYIKVSKEFTSIKDHDPLHITEAEARKILSDKATAAEEREIADFGTIKVLRGPYGPYATDGKKNVRVPKDVDPTKLTEVEAKKLLEKAPTSRGRRFPRRPKIT